MKKTFKMFGIVVLLAVIWFSMFACVEPDKELSALTGTVSITGTAQVGQILTANVNALGGSGTISYQWKRGTTVIGADSSTYEVQAADVGLTITVTVTRSGNSGNVVSVPTAVVTTLPALTGTVSIGGIAQVGQTLTVDTSSLGGSGTISYQWMRGTTVIGANSSTYEVQAADVGLTITVTVTRSGNSGSIASAPTAAVTNPILPVLTGTVSIAGTAQVGQTLTVNTNSLGGSGTITYQWMRGTTVIGANSSTYEVQAADVGLTITVTVTRSGNSGNVVSTPTAVVTTLPALTGTVSIGGIAQVGQTLTVDTSSLGGSGTISYQWMRGTTNIGTGTAYTVQAADTGSTITVIVTRAGNSGSVTSNPTAIVMSQSAATPGLSFALINSNTEYSVSRGTATAAEVIIPDTYNGLPVTAIANNGFSSYTNMTSINIPNRIMNIGNFAFSNCTNLTSITIPVSVTSIGGSAFEGCSKLAEVTLPSGINIGPYAFENCTGLIRVTFMGAITTSGFSSSNSFPGDLRTKYFETDGGAGIYFRSNGTSNMWIGAPTGASVTEATSNSITISWNLIPDAAGYRIYRSESSTGTYTEAGNSTTNTFTDTGLTEGTAYYYRVTAFYINGTSPRSNIIYTTTIPGIPGGVNAAADSFNSITVSWSNVSGATGYRIYRSESAAGTFESVGTSTTTSYTNNTGLTANTAYYYKVAAYNSNGTGLQSGAVNAVTLLAAPAGLNATSTSSNSITINWDSMSNVTGYRIYRGTGTGSGSQNITIIMRDYDNDGWNGNASIRISINGVNHSSNTKITSGSTGTYAFNANAGDEIMFYWNTGSYDSECAFAVYYTDAPPSTAFNPTSGASNDTEKLLLYRQYGSLSGASNNMLLGSFTVLSNNTTITEIGTSSTNSYTDTGLTAGTAYYYKIAAYNSNGTGPQSSVVISALTMPGIPGGVNAAADSFSSIIVSWSPVSGATGYRIYRSTSSTGTFSEIGTSATTSFANTGLTASTTYYYKVAAYNSGGTGLQSSAVNATTLELIVIEMVNIPAGSFIRDSNPIIRDSYTITLSAFKMGKYEVTQEQYQEVMGVNPSGFSSNPVSGEIQELRPVESVTWYDAVEFCNKLSELEGLTPVYTITDRTPATGYPIRLAIVTMNMSNNGYRLPTEAEWEYACRAGTTTDWYFGSTESQLVNYAWYLANSNSRTHQVGLKQPNAWGLYDMHGNVSEWCWDWHNSYPTSNQTNPTGPTGPAAGAERARRGGSYEYSAGHTHSADRDCSNRPDDRFDSIGFRVVRP